MFSTTAFNINIIRDAVDEFNARFTGFGTVSVLPTHITVENGAHGIAQSEDRGAVEAVERIAFRREQERREARSRQEYLRLALASGEITEEQFDREMCFA